MTTRARKIEYIRTYGSDALEKAAAKMLARKGENWLTDEQIEEITDQVVSDARFNQHINLQNRALRRERLADVDQRTQWMVAS